jgi:hypothetical protein
MYRLLFVLSLVLTLALAAHGADAPASAPVPQDFTDYGVGPTIFLFLVAALCSVVAAPICILFWGLFIFGLVKLIGLFGISPQALLMKLAQRQMAGRGKGLVWQLGILICLPAGVLGLWLAIWMFGVRYQSMSLLVMGSAIGVITAVGFVWLAKMLIQKMRERMMGGMDPQMMAQMMQMQRSMQGGSGLPNGGKGRGRK